MKKTLGLLARLLFLSLIICLFSAPPGTAQPTRRVPTLVIVSPQGEVTRDCRYVGEFIRYKIHYANPTGKQVDLIIVDQLDPNLTQVKVFNDGEYNPATHQVVWKIRDVTPSRKGAVEFEAAAKDAGAITNQAKIYAGKGLEPTLPDFPRRLPPAIKTVTTNAVQATIYPSPAVGWIPFEEKAPAKEPPRSTIKDETTTGLMVNFDLPGMFVHEVLVDGLKFHRLSFPGKATRMDLGQPEVPIVGQVVEVPMGVNFTPEVVQTKSIKLEPYNVFPAQKRQIRQPGAVQKDFAIDRQVYTREALFPEKLVEVKAEDIGVMRGHRLVLLKVQPVQFNPVTRETKAFSNIEVRLRYDRLGQILPAAKRLRSPAFEQILKATVMNYKETDRFDRDGGGAKEGCDYLILTHATFYNAADPNNPIVRLRNWKERKGLKTKVVDVANITGGATAANIKAYLQNIYNTWAPPPTYVLLVGDAEFIPPDYQTDHPDGHLTPAPAYAKTKIGTDLYYSTLDGNDYFPDILIGRLSVDTLAQATDVVDKILAYEQTSPPGPNYYTNTSLVCLFEDNGEIGPTGIIGNGREEQTFRIVEFAEAIRAYLNNNQYNCNRIYTRSGNFANGPQRYEDSTNLPVELTLAGNPPAVPGFPWSGGTADITAAINAGNFIVTYDGHGSRTAMSNPRLNNNDVAGLTNGALTPVVFSLACQTGWFDNETDDAQIQPATGQNDECFCEQLLRRQNAGAAAVMGATRNSWDPNDFMMLGIYKALWPDFNPAPPSSKPVPAMQSPPLTKMGQINTFSKIYMANTYGADIHRKCTFEMYHIFGDPEMAVWTRAPVKLKVSHPEGIGAGGEQDFIVKVANDADGKAVANAVVTLVRDNSNLSVKQTDAGGRVRFTVNLANGSDLDLTVTATNFLPYQGKIKVSSDGACLNRLDPQNGPENQAVHVGGQNFSGTEKVDLYLDNQKVKDKDAAAGSFGQAGVEDVDISIPSPYALGPVNVGARGQTSGRYAVEVFQVRTANPIDLFLYSQWDSSTWNLSPGDNPVWNNPDIQIYDAANNPVDSNNLTVGQDYTIRARIHNDTDFQAQGAKVTFKWADFGVGQPDRVWNVIKEVPLDVAAHSAPEASAPWRPTQTGHLCVLVETFHVEDINANNNRGQENCHVGPTSSPARVPFQVWNPTDQPAAVFLELRQLIPPNRIGRDRLWATEIKHPDPQVIPPGKMREAMVIIDPGPADVKKGAKADFALTAYINGKMIGGVNFTIENK